METRNGIRSSMPHSRHLEQVAASFWRTREHSTESIEPLLDPGYLVVAFFPCPWH